MLTLLDGWGLLAVLEDGRAERADDEALVDDAELLLAGLPDPSGAAEATAAPAPEAMSKPAPTANPNVVIRLARLLDITLAPAYSTANYELSTLTIAAR